MSGLESRLLAEQARANLLGGIGSNVLAGLFTPQVTKSGTVIDPGGFGDIGSIIEGIGGGSGGLFDFLGITDQNNDGTWLSRLFGG
jgi:hypothetical protein